MFVSLCLFYTQKTHGDRYSAEGFKKALVHFFKITEFVKQVNVYSQLYCLSILDMWPRSYFFSHTINTNGFSKNKLEAFLGLWDLSSMTYLHFGDYFYFCIEMLCFWVINSARLLGIKYYQKSLGLRVDPQGRAYQEDQSSRLSTKVFQSGLWGLALLTALLLRRKLIPSLTAGWWAWFCTHKGKPHLEGMKLGPRSAWL